MTRLAEIACDASYAILVAACHGEPAVVSPAEKEALRKIREGNYELVLKDDLAKLRNIGRYQQFIQGGRTWRLDTATGQSCLLLASPADWEKPDSKARACTE